MKVPFLDMKIIGLKDYALKIALAVLIFLFFWFNKDISQNQYYDASHYFSLHYSFSGNENHVFSFLNFPDTYRGYAYPFLLWLFSFFCDGYSSVWVLNFLFFTVLCFYIFPAFAKLLFHKVLSPLQIGIFSAMYLFFWKKYFFYALSDFPAIITLLLSVLLVLKNNNRALFFSGFFLCLSFNIRPMYQVSIVPFVLFLLLLLFKRIIKVHHVILFLLGSFLVIIPQMLINKKHNNTYSPFIQTSKFFGKDLYTSQLYWGLTVHRYETFVGDPLEYASPSVSFNEDITNKLNIDHTLDNTLEKYVQIVFNNPMEMLHLYAMHLFNGFDLKSNEGYLTHIKDFNQKYFFSFTNYLIIFCSIAFFIFNAKKISLSLIFVLSNIIIPVLLVVPTAIENRFFLGGYLLFYFVCSVFYKEIILFFNKKPMLIVGFLFFLAMCFNLSNTTYHLLFP